MYTLTDLCCLCLVNGNTVRSILLQDNDGIVVKNKLEYVLSEVIHFSSEVLNNICIDCLNALNYVYKFKRECLQNLISLNNYIGKMSIKSQKYNYSDHPGGMQDQTTSANHFTKIEIKQERADSDEIIQIKKSHSSQSQELKYAMINEECTVKSDSSQHSLRENQIPENNEEIEIIKQELEYSEDEIDVKSDPLLLDGEDSGEKNFPNESTNNSDCNLTSSEGVQNDRLKIQNVDIAKPYKCDQCHKAFPTSSKLKRHDIIHTGERPFKCTICQKTFKQIPHLNEHKRTHTGEKPFTCDVCYKVFGTKGILTIHKRMHNNVRPSKCLVCEKTFTRSGHLTTHMLIHTGEKPYKCQVCQYKCTHAGHLKTHMRIHTGEKPFTCEYCEQPFSDSGNLKKHVRRHHNKID